MSISQIYLIFIFQLISLYHLKQPFYMVLTIKLIYNLTSSKQSCLIYLKFYFASSIIFFKLFTAFNLLSFVFPYAN